jgi:tetratricopeptide (TPR) repeat protein
MVIRAGMLALSLILVGCAHKAGEPTSASPGASAPVASTAKSDLSKEERATLVRAGNQAFQRQDYEAAAKEYAAAVKGGEDAPGVHFRYGYALHVTGHPSEALPHHIVAASRITNPALRIDALYNAACANALLGRREDALGYFSRALHAGFKDTVQLERDTDLDSLREDAEFKALVKSIGAEAENKPRE